MDSILSKLNYREGQTIYVLNHPETFEAMLSTVPDEIVVKKEINQDDPVEFVIVFATRRAEVEETAVRIVSSLKGDAIFWLAYPKGTSKKYKCDFNRDTSWKIMTSFNLMPVRQIAIDEDWSALRFRKTEFIKSITRK